MRSLRADLAAWFFGLTMVLLVGFAVALHWQLRRALYEGVDGELEARAESLATLCSWEHDLGAVEFEPTGLELATTIAEEAGGGVRITIWPDRRVLHAAGAAMPPVAEPPEEAVFVTEPEGPELPRRRLCTLLAHLPEEPADEEDPVAPAFSVVVQITGSLSPVEAELKSVAWLGIALMGVAVVVVLFFALLLSRRFVRPLHALGQAAAKVRAGVKTAIPLRGTGDEVDQLAEVLSGAFTSLEESMARQARFTADAAHELRNPIAVIRTSAEVALRQERAPAQQREFFTDILVTAERMGRVVEALLTLARLDAGRLQTSFADVDLAVIAHDAATAQAPGSPRIRFGNGTPAAVHGDAGLLRILADNLVANALRYSDDKPVEVDVAREDDGRVALRVRDFGPGIPEETRRRVFERFFRDDPARKNPTGAGLGLSIVTAVARVHAAECVIEDAGPGTRVVVRFPPADATATAA